MVESRYDEPDIPPEPDDPPGGGWKGALFAIGFFIWLIVLFVVGRVWKDATLASWLLVGVPVVVIGGGIVIATFLARREMRKQRKQ